LRKATLSVIFCTHELSANHLRTCRTMQSPATPATPTSPTSPAKEPAQLRSAAAFLDHLQARGRACFTTQEAVRALGGTLTATRASLRRLKANGRIADPYRGFHVIVPPEYRTLGCRPAEQFVADLMAHIGVPYYAALLTAAAFHGAAHQAPMTLQVMVPTARRGIECCGVRVEFIARHDMHATPVVQRNTAVGVLRVASPEATALELVGYPERCGYLDNVATVLTELAEVLDAERLVAEAQRAPVAWVQRLGYLLALVGAEDLAASLEAALAERVKFLVALAPWTSMTGAPRDLRWAVAVNVKVEPDT
jgi:predicted transcriptional regulator of viral defense system